MRPVGWSTIVLFLVTAPLSAQSLISVVEVDENGQSNTITGKRGIVDINSTLEIGLDRSVLRARIVRDQGSDSLLSALMNRLAVLQQAGAALPAVADLAKAMQAYVQSPNDSTLSKLQQVYRSIAKLTTELQQLVRNDSVLQARVGGAFDSANAAAKAAGNVQASTSEIYAARLGELRAVAEETAEQLNAALTAQGIRIQLGSWVRGGGIERAVHLDAFNDTPEDTPFTVERFGIALSEPQKSQLEEAEQAAATFNRAGAEALVQDFGEKARSTAREGMERLAVCVDSASAHGRRALEGVTETVRVRITNVLAPLGSLPAALRALAVNYQNPKSGTALLGATNDDATKLTGILKTMSGVRSQLELALQEETVSQIATLVEEGRAILFEINGCIQRSTDIFGPALQGVARGLAALLGIQEAAAGSWETVRSHDLASLPESTRLMLARTGRRSEGDVVVLRLATRRGEGERVILETRELTMDRVLTHIDLSVGLIFADALGGTPPAVPSRFQAGPSYSILLKWGKRTSHVWNRLFSPGIGINVSSLDFDHDDTPELGLGLALAAFRNVLQAGIGYNIAADRGYWYFGVRLPVASFALPGRGGEGGEGGE